MVKRSELLLVALLAVILTVIVGCSSGQTDENGGKYAGKDLSGTVKVDGSSTVFQFHKQLQKNL